MQDVAHGRFEAADSGRYVPGGGDEQIHLGPGIAAVPVVPGLELGRGEELTQVGHSGRA